MPVRISSILSRLRTHESLSAYGAYYIHRLSVDFQLGMSHGLVVPIQRPYSIKIYAQHTMVCLPVTFPLVPSCHRFGKCVKICENFTESRMSTDLYLHEFVRALIASHQNGKSDWGKEERDTSWVKLLHRGGSSIASTAAVSTASASPRDNLIVVTDIERLRARQESRTTLMIKRVPRKYACYDISLFQP